jgi:hypothetical protein
MAAGSSMASEGREAKQTAPARVIKNDGGIAMARTCS